MYNKFVRVEFYFDPSCPFCWITSRWLLRVSDKRNLSILWCPFSLALKNDELITSQNKSEFSEIHKSSHRILRVITAARTNGANVIDLYTAFGIAYHLGKEPYDDNLIKRVLKENNLPSELIISADDTSLDEVLQQSISSATDIVGQDVGVPIIIFQSTNGEKNGYFGPVLDSLPDTDEGLQLWDGLIKFADNKHFYELKRSRSAGDPDVYSTGKC